MERGNVGRLNKVANGTRRERKQEKEEERIKGRETFFLCLEEQIKSSKIEMIPEN